MRHLILGVLAVGAAFLVGPTAHTLTAGQRRMEIAAVIGVFFLIDLVIGLAVKGGKKKPQRSGSPYGVARK